MVGSGSSFVAVSKTPLARLVTGIWMDDACAGFVLRADVLAVNLARSRGTAVQPYLPGRGSVEAIMDC